MANVCWPMVKSSSPQSQNHSRRRAQRHLSASRRWPIARRRDLYRCLAREIPTLRGRKMDARFVDAAGHLVLGHARSIRRTPRGGKISQFAYRNGFTAIPLSLAGDRLHGRHGTQDFCQQPGHAHGRIVAAWAEQKAVREIMRPALHRSGCADCAVVSARHRTHAARHRAPLNGWMGYGRVGSRCHRIAV